MLCHIVFYWTILVRKIIDWDIKHEIIAVFAAFQLFWITVVIWPQKKSIKLLMNTAITLNASVIAYWVSPNEMFVILKKCHTWRRFFFFLKRITFLSQKHGSTFIDPEVCHFIGLAILHSQTAYIIVYFSLQRSLKMDEEKKCCMKYPQGVCLQAWITWNNIPAVTKV